jgi:hypothetical protein
MNPNEIIVQATVGAMVLGVVIAACIWTYRRWGIYRARKQLVRSFEAVSAAARDVLIPDGSGGIAHRLPAAHRPRTFWITATSKASCSEANICGSGP